jgi:N-acetylglucosaminyl-diphospho-decaprenol L-rhamnosyltransferase
MPEIGIVIVTHNSADEIGACLDAALPTGAEIVVVDNASSDATVTEVTKRGVRLIPNASNRGFAAAMNQGISALNCSYVVWLNPDAILQTGLEALRAACDRPGAAGAGGQLLSASGRPQTGFMVRRLPTPAALIVEALLLNRVWPGNPVNRRYRGLDLDYSKDLQVEQPAGAFFMVRRDVWQELGGLDEGFFPIWFEDVDFCRRIFDRGLVLYYVPGTVAKHTGAHSIRRLSVEMRHFYWYGSLLKYSAKHFGAAAFRLVCLAVLTGSILRSIGESALERSFRPMSAYRKVVRLATRCFWSGRVGEALLWGPEV